MGFTSDGGLFIVSKFIEGGTLRDKIAVKRFNPEESSDMVTTTARALHHTHSRRLIHRDVKPANILLDDAGGERISCRFRAGHF